MFVRFLALAAGMIGSAEICSYVALSFSANFFEEPIWRTSTIYSDQSCRIRSLLANANQSWMIVDPVLGWRLRPGYDRDGTRINGQGLRAMRVYSPRPRAGTLRVAAFGDSTVFGSEVRNNQSWTHFAQAAEPSIEVLNFGVPGFGTDQALIRYESEGNALNSHVVIMGFTPVDMRRNVNVYRRFIHVEESPAAKPRFRISGDGSLAKIPPPVRSLDQWRTVLKEPAIVRNWGADDYFYEAIIYDNPLYDWSAIVRLVSSLWVRTKRLFLYDNRVQIGGEFNPNSEAFKIQVRILRRFVAHARANNHVPLLAMLPLRHDLEAHIAGEPTRVASLSRAVDHMLAVLDPTRELAAAAAKYGFRALFAPGGHYSELGNKVIGEWLVGELMHRKLMDNSNSK